MKKTIAALVALLLIFSLCACGNIPKIEPVPSPEPTATPTPTPEPTPTPAPEPVYGEVCILFTNDVHCGVDEGIGYNGVSYVRQALENSGMEVLLVDDGDFCQGGVIGTLSEGETVIELMNELKYDVAVPGNHEFDYGMEQFFKLAGMADFPIVSANFKNSDGKLMLEPYVILNAGGRKIAFVGICAPGTMFASNPMNFKDADGNFMYSFCQDTTGETLYNAVQDAVDTARANGADYVVALGHLGIELSSSPWTSGDVINNTTGIDALIDGHSHSVLECEIVKNAEGQDVLLSSTGTKLENLGCLTISPGGKLDCFLINSSFNTTLADAMSKTDELSNEVVAVTEVDLTITDPETGHRMVRSGETNLGDLSADAYLQATGAQIAFVNGGNVRADIPAGEITYGQIIAVSPFGNELCVAEVKGQTILDALEFSAASLPGEFGGFLQVSGITFTIDVSIESGVVVDDSKNFVGIEGERRVSDVMVGDEPLDPEATYTVASVEYLIINGGDGYSMFSDCNIIATEAGIDNQVLIDFIKGALGGTVGEYYADPYGEGRITILS